MRSPIAWQVAAAAKMSRPAVQAAKAGRPVSVNRVNTTHAKMTLTTDATIAAIRSGPAPVSEHRFAILHIWRSV